MNIKKEYGPDSMWEMFYYGMGITLSATPVYLLRDSFPRVLNEGLQFLKKYFYKTGISGSYFRILK